MHSRKDDHGALWRSGPKGVTGEYRPVIGIAPDVVEPRENSVRAMCALTYARAVDAAGGWPVILPPIVEMIPSHLARCDGFVLTGGDDPRTEPFGAPTHTKATPVHPLRQAFDTALLEALMRRTNAPLPPTLGVCLGMQMMAMVAGGTLNQYMPESVPTAETHWNNARHTVKPVAADGPICAWLAGGEESGSVTSHHRQSVADPGRMRVAAMSEDGVIEAIDRPDAPFFVGVQWHPERTDDRRLGVGVFEMLVENARQAGERSAKFRAPPGRSAMES